MTDWTEEAVREALACVDAEWRIWTSGGVLFASTGDVRPNLEITIDRDGEADIWVSGGNRARGQVRVPQCSHEQLDRALHALRTLVIATHGKDAWPWEMRETDAKPSNLHHAARAVVSAWRSPRDGDWDPVVDAIRDLAAAISEEDSK